MSENRSRATRRGTGTGAVCVGALLLVALLGPAGRADQPPSATDLAVSLQQRYDAIRDFSAHFEHTYEGGVLRKKVTERGSVQVKKPGKMRWDYLAPEKKLFVSDGVKIYSYVPADKQVIISPMPTSEEATTVVSFLTGTGNLHRDFWVSYIDMPGAPSNTYALKLTPKRAEQDYEWLTLVVDRESLQIRMLATTDSQGGTSTFKFEDLKENLGLRDRTFEFTIPRGVDVISNVKG